MSPSLPLPAPGVGTVLVVDDGEDNRALLACCLETAGLVVAEACHGLEALWQMRTRPLPSLVLLDLMMPVMDGWAFLNERARDAALRQVPVIVLSASSDARARVDRSEVLGVLDKPFDVHELMSLVLAICRPSPPR